MSALAAAVARSEAIAEVVVAPGALEGLAALHRRRFGGAPAMVVADARTWAAAGERAARVLGAARHVLPASPRPKPTVEAALSVARALEGAGADAVPVAVGSGVISDLVRFAAHRLGRPYLCVPSAASMDGYASAGAPLSRDGFKMTIPCRAPRAILADLDVVAAAPAAMSGWGYADLAGKVPAGGDWLIADALGVEPVDDVAWPMVQEPLRGWLGAPEAVRAGEPGAVADLLGGLIMGGLAMEAHGSSRPASGADHQIAHIWEMEGLSQDGEPVAHGACVAVGALAALSLIDWAIGRDLSALDPRAVAEAAPSPDAERAEIDAALAPEVAERAREETCAKRPSRAEHEARLRDLAAAWPALRERLRGHLWRAPELRARLAAAGAPTRPEEIGVDAARLAATIRAARFIRRRYTVLDLLSECGLLDEAIRGTVGAQGRAA